MVESDVIDEFHDDDGFSHPGATKQPDLSPFCIGLQKVNDLNAGFQYFRFGFLIF